MHYILFLSSRSYSLIVGYKWTNIIFPRYNRFKVEVHTNYEHQIHIERGEEREEPQLVKGSVKAP